AIGVDTLAIGVLPVPYAKHAVRQLDGQPHPHRAAPMVADAPGVVALAPPVADFDGLACRRVGAVVPAGLNHVALVPERLGACEHGPPPESALPRSRREGEIEANWRSSSIDEEPDLPEGLDNVDTDGSAG